MVLRRGTPTGHAIVPLIKITGNKITFQNMIDNIDFDASPVVEGVKSIEELGKSLLEEVIEVANGKMPKAEALGFSDTAINRLCNYV